MKDVTFLNWTFNRIEKLFFIIRGFLGIQVLIVWHIVVLILKLPAAAARHPAVPIPAMQRSASMTCWRKR